MMEIRWLVNHKQQPSESLSICSFPYQFQRLGYSIQSSLIMIHLHWEIMLDVNYLISPDPVPLLGDMKIFPASTLS